VALGPYIRIFEALALPQDLNSKHALSLENILEFVLAQNWSELFGFTS
jgi:hypothetical protein